MNDFQYRLGDSMKIHPLTAIVFTILLFFITLYFDHPLYILSIFIFLMIYLLILDKKTLWKKIIKYSLYNALFIILINPLVSKSGRTVLYKSPHIPMFGKIKITIESLAFGTNMGLKLICIIFIFSLYGLLTDRDDTFVFFSKYAHKLTLMLSMTNNIIHRLILDIKRVREVMILRGVCFNEKNLFKRIHAYYPLLKVVLISALEGSIDRAEALYSKQYGMQKRTSYISLQMKKVDHFLNISHLILFIVFILGILKGYGNYNFYPTLQPFEKKELCFLVLLNIPLLINILIIWGCKYWRFSISKT